MIKPIGQALSAAVDATKLRESGQTRAPAKNAPTPAAASMPDVASTPAARMAAQGAPIDTARIERIKDAIAQGNYPVDPDKIARKMIDLDLPAAKH